MSARPCAGNAEPRLLDHWVPGANNTLTKLWQRLGEKKQGRGQDRYITSQGEKDKLTAAAEAQPARPRYHVASRLEHSGCTSACSSRSTSVNELIKQYVPSARSRKYLARIKGTWRGVPTTVGSQVSPASRASSLPAALRHRLRECSRPTRRNTKGKTDNGLGSLSQQPAEQLFKAGHPVGLPMGQTSDAVDWSAAVQFLRRRHGGRQGQHQGRFAEPARPRISQEADAVNPPGLCLGRRRQQPLDLSARARAIMNPPSSWAVAKRDIRRSPRRSGIIRCRADEGPLRRQLPQFYGCGNSPRTSRPQGLLLHLSRKESVAELMEASSGYDLPSSEHVRPRHLEEGRAAARHHLFVSAARRRGHVDRGTAGAPRGRRPIYNQAINTVMWRSSPSNEVSSTA